MHPDTLYHAMIFGHAEMQERAHQRYLVHQAKLARKAARRDADPAGRGWLRFPRPKRPAVPATA